VRDVALEIFVSAFSVWDFLFVFMYLELTRFLGVSEGRRMCHSRLSEKVEGEAAAFRARVRITGCVLPDIWSSIWLENDSKKAQDYDMWIE
jgi:hypothetical protein